MLRAAILASALVALVSCTPPPALSPPSELEAESPVPAGEELRAAATRACANLKYVGCPEGANAKCVDVFVSGSELRRARGGFPLRCWSYAADKPSALACGSLRCVR